MTHNIENNFYHNFLEYQRKINLETFEIIQKKFPSISRDISYGITYENKYRFCIEENRSWHYKIDFLIGLDGKNFELIKNSWAYPKQAEEIIQFAVQTIKDYYPSFKKITAEYLSLIDKNIEPDYNKILSLKEQVEKNETTLWDNLPKWLKYKVVSFNGNTFYYKNSEIIKFEENGYEIQKGIGFLHNFVNKKIPIKFEEFLKDLKNFLDTLIVTESFKKHEKDYNQYKHLSKTFAEKYGYMYSYYDYVLKFKETYG